MEYGCAGVANKATAPRRGDATSTRRNVARTELLRLSRLGANDLRSGKRGLLNVRGQPFGQEHTSVWRHAGVFRGRTVRHCTHQRAWVMWTLCSLAASPLWRDRAGDDDRLLPAVEQIPSGGAALSTKPSGVVMTPASAPVTAADTRAAAERLLHLEEQCMCGHPRDEHDPIATRYCAATFSNRLRRGCICMAPAPTADDRS